MSIVAAKVIQLAENSNEVKYRSVGKLYFVQVQKSFTGNVGMGCTKRKNHGNKQIPLAILSDCLITILCESTFLPLTAENYSIPI